jgi:hypothetical protein
MTHELTLAVFAVAAYSETMRILLIPGIVVAIVPLVAAFFVKGLCLLCWPASHTALMCAMNRLQAP